MQHCVVLSAKYARGLHDGGPRRRRSRAGEQDVIVSYLAAQIREVNPLVARTYAGVEQLVPPRCWSTHSASRSGRCSSLRNSELSEAKANTCDDPRDRVPQEADLLASAKAASRVANWDLPRRVSQSDHLPNELPVEVESIRDEVSALQALGSEHLVHRERIMESNLVREVEQRQQHPMCGVRHKAGQGLVGVMLRRQGSVQRASGSRQLRIPDLHPG